MRQRLAPSPVRTAISFLLALPRASVTPGRARQCDRPRGKAAAATHRARQVEKIPFKLGAQAGVGGA